MKDRRSSGEWASWAARSASSACRIISLTIVKPAPDGLIVAYHGRPKRPKCELSHPTVVGTGETEIMISLSPSSRREPDTGSSVAEVRLRCAYGGRDVFEGAHRRRRSGHLRVDGRHPKRSPNDGSLRDKGHRRLSDHFELADPQRVDRRHQPRTWHDRFRRGSVCPAGHPYAAGRLYHWRCNRRVLQSLRCAPKCVPSKAV
jgi:hypothetical protein